MSQRQITDCLAESIYAHRISSGKATVLALTHREEPILPTDSAMMKADSILYQRSSFNTEVSTTPRASPLRDCKRQVHI
ncbi:MAG TPA: hypothetical protein DCE55_09405 [Planctomycetaceae bacterium]|nr:hypothetical protein [Planctomycetaceae bacterium]